jgi:hypothetical protein
MHRAAYLNTLCQTKSDAAQLATEFYVRGLLDQHTASSARVAMFLRQHDHEPDLDRALKRADKVLNFCIPNAVDVAVVQKAFCAHLAAYPQNHDQPAVEQFVDAMAKTWPCS